MKLFCIKPYRRRAKKPRKKQDEKNLPAHFGNLLLQVFLSRPNLAWVSDFTYIAYKSRFLYLATVMDLFTRRLLGFNVLTSHTVELVRGALFNAIKDNPKPEILHSDQGREYASKEYTSLLKQLRIYISMSRKSCPWENGYQEAFYSQFKLDLGDPNRFESLGELTYAIYQTIHYYNHERIHTKLKMPPEQYLRWHKSVETVSKEMGT